MADSLSNFGGRFSRLIVAILAGGRSSRFGSSKLLVNWRGEPILAWQARLRSWGHEAWLNLPAEVVGGAPADSLPGGVTCFDRVIRDVGDYLGPLSGIAAILEAGMPGDLIAIVPADMPLIMREHLERLALPMCEANPPAVVMGRWAVGASKGRVEPLPSIWDVGRARPLVAQFLAVGAGPSKLAEDGMVRTIELGEGDLTAWQSINTPVDLSRMADGM